MTLDPEITLILIGVGIYIAFKGIEIFIKWVEGV